MSQNEEERSIWADACQLRRKYAQTGPSGHGLCSIIMETVDFQRDHNGHPMAAILSDLMIEEYKNRIPKECFSNAKTKAS